MIKIFTIQNENAVIKLKFSSILKPDMPLRSFSDSVLSYGNLIQKSNDCSKCQLFGLSDQIDEMICKPCRMQQAIQASNQVIDINQGDIYEHSQKVSYLSFILGKKLGLDEEDLKDLKLSALYHDIGKTKIPGYIINKPRKLNAAEWNIMKTHAYLGYEILNKDRKLRKIALYVKHHHERIDGKGYPDGLKGEEIPLISRIIAVVDAYDAMTSDRPYRDALSQNDAIEELIYNAGTQFDKYIVKIFINNVLN